MQKKVSNKKWKKVAVLIAIISSVLLINLVLAADVAYVYKKDYKVDENIINVFTEMGLTYELVNENSLPANFSKYKMIFVGDENFKNPNNLPIDKIPTIIANYYHGYELGLTDYDGISKLGSSTPLEVKKGGDIIQVYTQARYSIGSYAIPYYFLDDENKAIGMQRVAATWVGTAETGDSSQFGDVISYANPGIKLVNGKTTKEKICFFGIIESDYWTPAAKEMFKDCVGFVFDSCNKDSDCGEDETSDNYCEAKKVYRNITTHECINQGKINSECKQETEKEFVKECEHGCEDGECIGECVINYDCGTDYFSNNYCKNDDVYRTVFNYSCIFFECIKGNSSEKLQECGTDSCGNWENYCAGQEVWKQQTCYDKGCLNGLCFSNTKLNKTFVKTCEHGCTDGTCTDQCTQDSDCPNDYYSQNYCQGDNVYRDLHNYSCTNGGCKEEVTKELVSECEECVNGSCVGIQCRKNTDCGTNGYTGDRYCINSNVYEDFTSYTCHNPGKSNSYCSNYALPILIEYCEGECLNGKCITCFTNANCGKDGFIGNRYCSGKDVYQDYLEFLCINPATAASDCQSNVNARLVKECTEACVLGECKGIECHNDSECDDSSEYTIDECNNPGTIDSYCSHTEINCINNNDCGITGFFGSEYCSNNDLFKDYKNSTCINPGTKESHCTIDSFPKFILDCGEDSCKDWSYYCIDKDVWKERECFDRGCENGCFSKITQEKEKVKVCDSGCLNGTCTDECSVDADCKDSLFCNGEEKCIQGKCLGGTAIDCSIHNRLEIATCNNTPDSNPLTWDYRKGLSSFCNEQTDSCSTETFTLTHECNEVCGAECASDTDCTCSADYCNGTTLVDYPSFGNCGNSGITSCLCSCTPALILNATECRQDECTKDSDCGTDIYSEWNYYCDKEDLHKIREIIYKKCNNNKCEDERFWEDKFVEFCHKGCENGSCLNECLINSDCGTDYFSNNYCKNNDVYKDVFNFSCVLGLCSRTNSTEKVNDCGEDYCGLPNNYCIGKEVWKNQTCYDKGCANGECFSNTSVNKTFIETCTYGCLDGSCTNECLKESDCHEDYYGDKYCENNDSYVDFYDYSCSNGGCKEKIVKTKTDCGENAFGTWDYICKENSVFRNREVIKRGCENGMCYSVTSGENEIVEECEDSCVLGDCREIECSEDSDCGSDGWVENEYCICTSDVWDFWKEYTCKNPQTHKSKCTSQITPKLKQNCGNDSCTNWDFYCIGDNVWGNRTCFDYGCKDASCFEKTSKESKYIKQCEHGCTQGSCKEAECSYDSDCGTDSYSQWDYYCDLEDAHKIREIIYKKCNNYKCEEEHFWEDKFVEFCCNGCENGTCVGVLPLFTA